MPTHATTWTVWLALTACAAATPRPPEAPVDPQRHEVHLVAFADDHALLLERIVAAESTLRLQKVEPGVGPAEPVLLEPAAEAMLRRDWPGTERLPGALAATDAGAAWRRAGYRVPSAVADERLETPYGVLVLRDDAVWLISDHPEVELARLAPGIVPRRTLWWRDPAERWAALSASYDGAPVVVDLRLLDLAAGGARALGLAGYEAHGRKDYETAAQLWSQAIALDGSDATLHYNLACADALLKRWDRALTSLRRAVELGGDRFRALAEGDDDLDGLRGQPAFEALIARPTRD